ncbi:MAG: hypothetical protein ACI9N0_002903 [Ilumatobacter sp.]|jgi:hypothetical protein
MKPPPRCEVEVVLRAAVSHGVGGAAAWPTVPLGANDFHRVLKISMQDRLLGALAEAASDGAFRLLPEQSDQLTEQHAASQAHMLRLERMLLDVAEAFGGAGINFRVLKGASLAHLVYADPAWRNAADIDLLIPSHQFDAAVRIAIDQLGGEQVVPELRPGFDREFGKESLVRIGKLELDLHRTFVAGPFGLSIDLDELFRDGTEITIGGRQSFGLGAEHRFLHACYDTALGDYPVRLGSVRDLLLCRTQLQADLDQVVATARRWRGLAVVQRAAQLVVDSAGAEAGVGFAELAAIDVPRRQAWLLRSYLTPARSYSRPLASLAAISGVRARLRYMHAILVPSAAYLRSRGWTERSHLRRSLHRLSRRG